MCASSCFTRGCDSAGRHGADTIRPVSDSPQKKRPAKAPFPGPDPRRPTGPENPVVDRRKVVFGLGFGVVAAAGARYLDTADSSTVSTSSSATPASTADDTAAADAASGNNESPITTSSDLPQTEGSFEAPILDSSKRLAPGQTADVVFTGARIIDPDSGFDRIGNLALIGTTIVEISDQPIAATREIPAANLVISPGFIDMLSYAPNEYGEWWKVADGVTTNVGMHGLRFDADGFYDRWSTTGVPINFGGAVHNSHVRSELGFPPDSPADTAGIIDISREIESQIKAGYLGIHVQPEYAPGVSPTELMDMGRIAADLDVPLCVHARFSDNLAPGLQAEATSELVSVARETGCHVHIEHLNSTGGTGRMAEALEEVSVAVAEGLRMTTCMYPYEFWATTLKSARFRDWQEKFGISYEDLQVAGSNVRLTEATFAEALDGNLLTAAFAIPAGDIDLGVQAPFMMIGSDAILEPPHNNHPRSTGCFSRTIAEYSRNKSLVSLSQALEMMTIRPAKLLEISSPQMSRKGRLQIGADADITVFDPATIGDRSTIENPAQESVGVKYVFVNGTEVRNLDGNVTSAKPGVAIRSDRA